MGDDYPAYRFMLLDVVFFDSGAQRVFSLSQEFVPANDLAYKANRGELDGIQGANHGAGGTADHAGLRRGDNGFVGLIIKSIDIFTAGCNTHAAAYTTLCDNRRVPLDGFTQNSVSGGFSCFGHF